MIVDFKDIPESVMKNFKGGQKEVVASCFSDENNRLMYGHLSQGASIGLHTHTDSSEILFLLQGELKAIYDGKEEIIHAGQVHYCPKGHSHTVENLQKEEAIFFTCVVRQ